MRQGQGQGIGWGKRSLLWCKTFQRDWTEGACDKKYSWCKATYWYPTKNWGIFQLSCWLAHLWEGNNKHSLPTLDSSLTWDYNCFIQQRYNILVPTQCKFDRNVPCCSKTSVSSAEFCCHILKWQGWFIVEFLHRSFVLRALHIWVKYWFLVPSWVWEYLQGGFEILLMNSMNFTRRCIMDLKKNQGFWERKWH